MRWKAMAEQLWTAHQGLLLFLAVLLTLNLVIFVFVEQSISPELSEKESQFFAKQNEIREILHKQSATAQSPEQIFLLAGQDLEKFYSVVPEYDQFTDLIEELLVLSSRSRLDLSSINYKTEPLDKIDLMQVGVSFNVSGQYGNLKKFIHSLEQSKRLISITQINLQESDQRTVNLRLNLATYFRPGGQKS